MFGKRALLLTFLIFAASQAHSTSDYEIRPRTLTGLTYKITSVPFHAKFFYLTKQIFNKLQAFEKI
jgi:hypothetical protein